MAYLPGSLSTITLNTTAVEFEDINTIIPFSILIRRPNRDGRTLKEHADGVLNGTLPMLSRDEFNNTFGAVSEDLILVENFLTSNGITLIDSHSPSANIQASGTVDQINKLFQIELKQYTYNNEILRGFTGEITIPDNLLDVIDAVIGLNTINKPKTFYSTLDATLPKSGNSSLPYNMLTPPQVASAYNFPTSDGSGTTIGLLEFGGGYTASNLNSSFARIGLQIPKVVDVLSGGQTNSVTSIPNDNIEVMLDIYCSGGVAPNAKIAVYFTSDWYTGLNSAVHDTVNNPDVISISWALQENLGESGYFQYVDTIFQAAAVLGITIFAATGDSGTKAESNSGAYTVNWPATSPYVVAVGGTTLQLSNGVLASETVWNAGNGGSGGGISGVYDLPSWQTDLYSTTYRNGVAGTPIPLTMRGIPDVSANADPNTGYEYFVHLPSNPNYLIAGVGGTSASAPMWAGLMTRLISLSGRKLGFINPTLYTYKSSTNDITIGNNSVAGVAGYAATSGPTYQWDAASGLGSPNGQILFELFLPPVTHAVSQTIAYNAGYTHIPVSITGFYDQVSIVSNPSNGTATSIGNSISYIPNNNYYGVDLFEYNASGVGGTSLPANVNLFVSPPPPPVANEVHATVLYGSNNNSINPSVSGTFSHVSVVIPASNGIAVSGGKYFLYTPNTSFYGSDSFAYEATGPGGNSIAANVRVTVNGPEPILYPSTSTVVYDSSATLISFNFIDPPGVPLTSVNITSLPSNGVASSTGTNLYYTPNDSFNGSDHFTISATNQYGTSANADVTVIVTPPLPAVAENVNQTVLYNSVNNIIIPIINSTGTYSSVSVISSPLYGTTAIDNKVVLYTPNSGTFATDQFFYSVTNPGGTSNTATMVINIGTPTITVIPSGNISSSVRVNSTLTGIAITAQGGVTPYTFSFYGPGPFPPGVQLNSNGVLSGTPTHPGSYNFGIQVTDGSQPTPVTTVTNYILNVYPTAITGKLQWITPNGLLFTVSSGGTESVILSTNDTSTTYSIISGSLPNTFTLSSNGLITGTATPVLSKTTSTFVVRGTTSLSKVIDETFSIEVLPVTAPVWSYTATDFVLPGPSIDHLFIDREYVNVQLSAIAPLISTTDYSIHYNAPFDSLPNGLSLSSEGVLSGILELNVPIDEINTFTFAVIATDGVYSNTQTFSMNVVNPGSIRADSTLIGFNSNTNIIYVGTLTTATVYDGLASISAMQAPIFLRDTYLGSYSANDYHIIPVTAFDPDPSYGNIKYVTVASTLSTYNGKLQLDVNSGSLYGYISTQTNYKETHRIAISAIKTDPFDGSTASSTALFTYDIVQKNPDIISWVSTSNLGTVVQGLDTGLQIVATHTETIYPLAYSVVGGDLPTGVTLTTSGDISGAPASSGTYTFIVAATTGTNYSTSSWQSNLGPNTYTVATSVQSFELTVTGQPSPYTNIYIKPFLSIDQRNQYQNFVSNPDIFIPEFLYRPNDAFFGTQTNFTMYLEYGVQELNSSTDYISALQQNFYDRSFYFGDVKSITALDSNNNPVYDTVYVEVIDPEQGVRQEVTLNGVNYYPSSLDNMRDRLISLTSGSNYINYSVYPLWQQTSIKQKNGFIYGVVLCYAKPNQGYKIVDRYKSQLLTTFNFNQINFTVDRIIVENTVSSPEPSYLIFPNTAI